MIGDGLVLGFDYYFLNIGWYIIDILLYHYVVFSLCCVVVALYIKIDFVKNGSS